MAKKPKFKLGSEVRALARNVAIPKNRVIPNKKKAAKQKHDKVEDFFD